MFSSLSKMTSRLIVPTSRIWISWSMTVSIHSNWLFSSVMNKIRSWIIWTTAVVFIYHWSFLLSSLIVIATLIVSLMIILFLKWVRFHSITVRRFSSLSSFRFFLMKYSLWKYFIVMSENLNQHFSFVWVKEWQLKHFLKNLSSDWCLSLNVLLRLDDRFRLSNWDDLTSNALALVLFFLKLMSLNSRLSRSTSCLMTSSTVRSVRDEILSSLSLTVIKTRTKRALMII